MPYRRVVESVGDTGAWALFLYSNFCGSQAQEKCKEFSAPTFLKECLPLNSLLRREIAVVTPISIGFGCRLRSLII